MSESYDLMIRAIYGNRLDDVKKMITDGYDVNYRSKLGFTALMSVFENYHILRPDRTKILDTLLEAGADPNLGNYYGDTPLSECLQKIRGKRRKQLWPISCDPRYTARLLIAGADPNTRCRRDKESVFYYALMKGKDEEAALILQAGGNPLIGDYTDKSQAIGVGIFLCEKYVNMILKNTSDGVARSEYIEKGREILSAIIAHHNIIGHNYRYIIVPDRIGWCDGYRKWSYPYKGYLEALYRRFTREYRMGFMLLWHAPDWRWERLRRYRDEVAQVDEADEADDDSDSSASYIEELEPEYDLYDRD